MYRGTHTVLTVHVPVMYTCVRNQVNKESEATQIINRRKGINKKKQERLKQKSTTPADDAIIVPLIVKGDVSGSVEALIGILQSKQPDQIKLTVIHTGVGGVNDSDIDMASSVGGVVQYG